MPAEFLAPDRKPWTSETVSACGSEMPEISRFLGIVVYMYHRDHAPPHFHASYGEHNVVMLIGSGQVSGLFPPRALRLLREWYHLHRFELRANWELAARMQPLRAIDPLE